MDDLATNDNGQGQAPEEPGSDDEAGTGQASCARVDVDELGSGSSGRWLVTSRGSEHTFDLDAETYCRQPRPGHGHFPYDGEVVALTRVERWPRVGGTFFIWVDDPQLADLVEHWHQSSTVIRITQLPDADPGAARAGG